MEIGIILLGILLLLVRIVFRTKVFDELRRSQSNSFSQTQYKRPMPKPKVSPLQSMLDKSNQTIQKHPKEAGGYCDRGATFILLKQYDPALADLNKAIGLQPNYADAFNNRAVLNYRNNNLEQAVNDFDSAITHDSNDAYYHLNRAMVYKRQEDHLKAETDIETALDLNIKLVIAADKANLKQNVVAENIIWNRQLARLVFLKTELMFVKYDHFEHLDSATIV